MTGEKISFGEQERGTENGETEKQVDFQELAEMPDFSEHMADLEKAREASELRGGATTVSVYIRDVDAKELRRLKGKAEAYTPKRQEWHSQVLDEAVEAGRHVSEEMNKLDGVPPPIIIAGRGACGAGKTTAFKNLLKAKGCEVFNERDDIPGAVKPDYFKDVIIDEAARELGVDITSDQAHMESTGICKMYSERLKNDPDTSIIIDKQLEAAGDIPEIIEWGHETGKQVALLDNDVPVELSAFRVLKRKIGGADPTMRFGSVARGFIGIRANRGQVLEDVQDDAVSIYSLRAFDPVSKQQVEVIKKVDGKIVYEPGYEELGSAVSFQDEASARAEANRVENLTITSEYVEDFVSRYFDESNGPTKYSQEARDVLGAYAGLGITIGEALASKADAGINPDRTESGELIDPNYREKITAWVQQERAKKSVTGAGVA